VNLSETSALLALIASVDNRRVEDATVLAWCDILGDLPYSDCQRAVRQHFAGSTDYLMPAHIREAAIRHRNNSPGRAFAVLELMPPADPERVQRGLEECAAALSMSRVKRAAVKTGVQPYDRSEAIRQRAIERAQQERRPARLEHAS